MKKFLLTILALVFVASGVFATTSMEGPVNIPIRPIKIPTWPRPRQIVETIIEAYYSDGAITIEFAEDMGDVTVVVINETTGESWIDSVDGCGAAAVVVSGDSGYYTITIHTGVGDYYGEFLI